MNWGIRERPARILIICYRVVVMTSSNWIIDQSLCFSWRIQVNVVVHLSVFLNWEYEIDDAFTVYNINNGETTVT